MAGSVAVWLIGVAVDVARAVVAFAVALVVAVALAVWVELALAVADVLVVVLPELGLLDGLVLVLLGISGALLTGANVLVQWPSGRGETPALK